MENTELANIKSLLEGMGLDTAPKTELLTEASYKPEKFDESFDKVMEFCQKGSKLNALINKETGDNYDADFAKLGKLINAAYNQWEEMFTDYQRSL